MILEQALYSVVGSLASGHVYPIRLPRETVAGEAVLFPAIVYQLFSGSTLQAQDSRVARHPRCRFDVWAKTPEDIANTAQTLMNALDHNAAVHALLIYEQDISRETNQEESTTNLYHRVLDFYLWGS